MGHFILRWRCHCCCHHQALEQHGIKIKWSDVLFFLFLANCAWGERWHQGSQGKFLRNQFQPWWCGCSVAWRSFFSCNFKLINLFWIYQDTMCLDRLLADKKPKIQHGVNVHRRTEWFSVLVMVYMSDFYLHLWCAWLIRHPNSLDNSRCRGTQHENVSSKLFKKHNLLIVVFLLMCTQLRS